MPRLTSKVASVETKPRRKFKREPLLLDPGWTVKEAAAFLATTPKMVYELVGKRKLPYRKLGTKILFRREQLHAFLDQLPGVTVEEASRRVTEGF